MSDENSSRFLQDSPAVKKISLDVDNSPIRTTEMTEVPVMLDFASSDRAGRRNALPDILGSPAGVNPVDLSVKLAELTLTDGPGGTQSPDAEELSSSSRDTTEGGQAS